MDGSVNWMPFPRMLFIHSWSAGGSRDACFFQEDLGDELPLRLDLIKRP
jgi:hypothetical protein